MLKRIVQHIREKLIKKSESINEVIKEPKRFDIWDEEAKHCPICESELTNVYEKHWDYYEGTYMRYRLYCKNNCYARILDTDRPPHAQSPIWHIFGKRYYIFEDERKEKQTKNLYDAIDYWKTGERYLIEMLSEGECKWKD